MCYYAIVQNRYRGNFFICIPSCLGVMLLPAWRPFAKQLPEFLLMRRTIAQYKPCQAGRKARFLFGDIMARSSRWPYIRAQAWNRDKKARAVCHICNEPIDYFVPPSSTPDSYEPDHIIPVHMRPDLELDLTNIKASHRRCNRQRGDGTNGTNIIGERSRKW